VLLLVALVAAALPISTTNPLRCLSCCPPCRSFQQELCPQVFLYTPIPFLVLCIIITCASCLRLTLLLHFYQWGSLPSLGRTACMACHQQIALFHGWWQTVAGSTGVDLTHSHESSLQAFMNGKIKPAGFNDSGPYMVKKPLVCFHLLPPLLPVGVCIASETEGYCRPSRHPQATQANCSRCMRPASWCCRMVSCWRLGLRGSRGGPALALLSAGGALMAHPAPPASSPTSMAPTIFQTSMALSLLLFSTSHDDSHDFACFPPVTTSLLA
jgi:hypothetical protein